MVGLAAQILSAAVALAVGIGLLTVEAVPQDSSAQQAQAMSEAAMEAAMEEMRETLEQLDRGEIEEEAEAVASERGLYPSAMTCGMRRPGVQASASREDRRRFSAAALATDPDFKREILAALAQHEAPAIRARAHLGLAHLAMRLGDAPTARRHAEAMLAEPEVPPTCQSDAWFTIAAAVAGSAEEEAALAQAVALDPGSWNAQLALTGVLASALERPAPPGQCAARARALVRAVVMLDSLAESDEQLAWIESRIGYGGADPAAQSAGRAFVLGMVRERSARPQAAIETYAEGTRAAATDACGAILQQALAQRLTHLTTEAAGG